MEKKAGSLHDDEKELLASLEGRAAFHLLLPLIRELAIYIAGHGAVPPTLGALPDLKSPAALARAEYRRATRRDV